MPYKVNTLNGLIENYPANATIDIGTTKSNLFANLITGNIPSPINKMVIKDTNNLFTFLDSSAFVGKIKDWFDAILASYINII